jgi:sugar/nucleoside kinase (ribokinase family)
MKKILTVGSAMLDLFLDLGKNTLPCIEKKESRQNFMLLEVGRKVEIPSIHRCSGGGATNAAVSFSRQGFEVSAFFKTGTDCESEFIKRQLSQDNVDTSASITTKDTPTGLSIIFPCPDGDRTTLTYRGASITLTEQELPLALLKNFIGLEPTSHNTQKDILSKNSATLGGNAATAPKTSTGIDCLYVTSLSGATAPLLLPLVKAAHEQKIFVACNPGSSQLRAGAHDLQDALPYIDVLVMNSEEALECLNSFVATGLHLQDPVCETNTHYSHEQSTHERKTLENPSHAPELLCTPLVRNNLPLNLRQYFAEILKRGPKIAVVTNGKEGVYVAHTVTHNNELLFHPSLPAEVVNTLGAGDAFGSGFVGALLQNLAVEQALIQGLVQATAVISVLDAQSGLLTTGELKKRMTKISMEKLQRFTL